MDLNNRKIMNHSPLLVIHRVLMKFAVLEYHFYWLTKVSIFYNYKLYFELCHKCFTILRSELLPNLIRTANLVVLNNLI